VDVLQAFAQLTENRDDLSQVKRSFAERLPEADVAWSFRVELN